MFDVLPVKLIREEDVPLIGRNLVNLGRLTHFELPVADGIVVIPPDIRLKTVLEHFKYHDREVFEQSLHLVKAQVSKIPPPPDLEKLLSKKKIDPKNVWSNLLETWVEEIRSRIWREGFSKGLTENLTAHPIFFTGRIEKSGTAQFNASEKRVEVNIVTGTLSEKERERIEEVILKADKILFLPHVYNWIVDGDLKIVKVSPYTEDVRKIEIKDHVSPVLRDQVNELKTVTKVFLKMDSSFKTATNMDGALICGEDLTDFDSKVLKIVETSMSVSPGIVIFKLSDIKSKDEKIRGVLRLLHQKPLLKSDSEAFLFPRHKKSLLNIQLAVPFTRSVDEFTKLKRELASHGIARKASLKLWLELAVPENIINLADYIEAGLDGVIINLDEVASFLGGYDLTDPESVFYKKQIKALLKFLESGLKELHKARVPVLVSGELTLHDEVLAFLLEKGIWGVVVDLIHSHSVKHQVHFYEKRHFKSAAA